MKTCKYCGNTNQDDFDEYRFSKCKICRAKDAAEYRIKNPNIIKTAQKAIREKRKPVKVEETVPDEGSKLFDSLLNKAKDSGRYVTSQLNKTRKFKNC